MCSCVVEKFACVQISDFSLGDEVGSVKVSHSCVGKRFLVLPIKFAVLRFHIPVLEKVFLFYNFIFLCWRKFFSFSNFRFLFGR